MEDLPYEARKQALIEEITAAFDGVEREDGVSLHEAPLIDDYRIYDRDDPLRVEARAEDNETRWQDVPDEHIASQILLFLDPKGFRYYIPVFLIWYLRYMDSEGDDTDFDDNTFGEVDFLLCGGTADTIEEYYLTRFSTLTTQQSQAIAHFLEFMIGRLDKLEAEDGTERQAEIAQGEMIEEAHKWRDSSQQSRLVYIDPEEALKRYWGQFL